MTTFWIVVAILAVLVIGIAFLQRFYRKATRESALIRTGFGGQKVVMDGGFVVLPFLHRVEHINMRVMRLDVNRAGPQSLRTEDRLRVDVEVEFYLRVQPSADGVALAAQTLGSRSLNADDLAKLLEGRLVDAMQAVVASSRMDELHENRKQFVADVRTGLDDMLSQNGLQLQSVSLTQMDQTPFSSLDENNAFNAVGMRRLSEVIATNRKERARIESEADVAVRQTHLDAMKQRLEIEQAERQAEIEQTLAVESLQAKSNAETESARQQAEQQSAAARIEREREVRLAEIDKDLALRKSEVEALLAAETAKIDSQVALADRRATEVVAKAKAEAKRAEMVTAEQNVQTERDRLAAERERELAVIRARQKAEVSETETASEAQSLLEIAKAETHAKGMRAEAMRNELKAEAEGRAALIAAENALTPEVIAMKVDMHKVDRLPDLAERMAKPLEKIDSIRINHVSGLGNAGGGKKNKGGNGPVDNAVDGVLNMALQLPAMQKLGQSIGVNLDLGDDGDGAAKSAPKDKKD